MNKVKVIALTVLLVLPSGLILAKDAETHKSGMKDKAMMGMMGMCQSMMNKPSMVAVGDGVVVLSGKKLYKYDANLNLVKEAEIKVEDMGMMKGGMMNMMGGGMMGKGMDSDDKAPAAGEDEHESHHPKQ